MTTPPANKKIILHFIHDLMRGGAETMLVRTLADLKEYHNVVVTLNNVNHFGEIEGCDELIAINASSFPKLPLAVWRFKKILRRLKPDIVHSHLALPNFIARLALINQKIPFISTIHNTIRYSADYKKWHIRNLDRITYKLNPGYIIGVSQSVMDDYFAILNIERGNRPSNVVHTFVDEKIFCFTKNTYKYEGNFRFVTAGSFKPGKNIQYLVSVFAKLKDVNPELHIYGRGLHNTQFLSEIKKAGISFYLKGQVDNLNELLPTYDAYIMPSKFEGFSLSVLEAMAAKLPLLLSNIPSFREQASGVALFFDLEDEKDCVAKIKQLMASEALRFNLAEGAYNMVKEKYTYSIYLGKLKNVYNEIALGYPDN